LLANLLAHRAAPGEVALLAPLERTAPFTQVIDAIAADGPPTTIGPQWQRVHGSERVVTVPGISAVLRAGAERLKLPSELGIAWAAANSPARGVQQTLP
jgi:hypothetical protein